HDFLLELQMADDHLDLLGPLQNVEPPRRAGIVLREPPRTVVQDIREILRRLRTWHDDLRVNRDCVADRCPPLTAWTRPPVPFGRLVDGLQQSRSRLQPL